ncbi:MAG: agmatine deiminase family protein [Pseudomonadota bacterium]
MPAEFEPHSGCWMAWPCNSLAFGDRLDQARNAYAAVARAISEFEPVTMIANPGDLDAARAGCGPGIGVLEMDIDDSWTRDAGPTFVVDPSGRVAGVDWRFNGWGGVFPDHARDAQMARAILAHLNMRRIPADFVLEGGAIHVDGQGTLLAAAPCLLDPRRNPGLSLGDLEELLARFLGVKTFIWLDHGLENDETAGHIDNVACFAAPGTILLCSSSDPLDGNHATMRENARKLRSSRDAAGRAPTVVEIEQPARKEGKDGRLAMSYINFYLPNGGVVAPSFDDPRDEEALATLKKVFPGRRVVQVPGLDIVYGGGCIHCITQQQPLGSPLAP